MKAFIATHKKGVLITATAILLASLVAALCVNQALRASKKEAVPPGRVHDVGVFGDDVVIHDSTEGEVVIDAADNGTHDTSAKSAQLPMKLIANPEDIWNEDTYAGNHTPVAKAVMQDGSVGVLTIDKLKLSVNVYDSTNDSMVADMSKGIAHFPSTSVWDGTVGMSAHNINYDGSDGFFKNLYTLSEGDLLHYKTSLGERTYVVNSVTTIAASDWSPLRYEDFNNLTLITCISGQPQKRLCVKASEQVSA